MKAGEEEATNASLNGLVSQPVDVATARRGGKLLDSLCSRGRRVGMADTIISVSALEIGVPVLISKVSHYPFTEMEIVKGSGV